MKRILPLALFGCGASLTAMVTATSPAPAADVFTCAREQIRALAYEQTSYDVGEQRLTARRIDPTARRPDVRFRRLVDHLAIEIDPTATGEASLTVEAATYGEYATQRGFTLEQERASDGVKAAAQALVEQCGR